MSTTKPCRCCHGSGKEIDAVAIGAEMRAFRVAKNISMSKVACRLGLSLSYVGDLELGRRGSEVWNEAFIKRFKEACG